MWLGCGGHQSTAGLQKQQGSPVLGLKAERLWLLFYFSQMHHIAGTLFWTNQIISNKSSGEVNIQHMPRLPVKAERL